jgi:hypothetical protein
MFRYFVTVLEKKMLVGLLIKRIINKRAFLWFKYGDEYTMKAVLTAFTEHVSIALSRWQFKWLDLCTPICYCWKGFVNISACMTCTLLLRRLPGSPVITSQRKTNAGISIPSWISNWLPPEMWFRPYLMRHVALILMFRSLLSRLHNTH